MTLETKTLALPTLEGFTFRHFKNDDDYAHMARLQAAQSDAEHLDSYPTPDWLKSYLEAFDHFDVRRDVLLVEDATCGDMVAYGRMLRIEQLDGTRRFSLLARTAPAGHAADQMLWQWLETLARDLNAVLPPNDNTVFETWAMDTQTRVIALLTTVGYAPTRYGYEMMRPLDNATSIPDFPVPAGLEIRPVLPEHYRAVWDAGVEAFRDHNGFAEPSEARYQVWLKDTTYFQPDLWKVAWDIDKNEIAGMVRNYIVHEENVRHNRKRGYTEDISTRRPYRRRGLARALIVESLRMFTNMGMTEAALGVDVTNPTGALRVYEDCGFKSEKTEIVYRKQMHAA